MRCRVVRLCFIRGLLIVFSGLFLSGCFLPGSERIQQKIDELEAQIEALPHESLNLAPWTLGYHSQGQETPESNIEIIIQFENPAPIDLVALMPSTYTEDGQQLKTHSFPKRFTIEYLDLDGEYQIFSDRSGEDYEIQGVEPQLFSLPDEKMAAGIRLRVTRLSENKTWAYGKYRFALGEIFVFSGNWNVALNQRVSVDSQWNYSYIWRPEALVDGFSLFSPIDRAPENPNTTPLRLSNTDELELTFDLGRVSSVDEFHFWPLVHDLQFNYPPSSGIGFPRGIQIILATRKDFQDARTVYSSKEVYPRAGSDPLMLRTPPHPARYIKMKLDNVVHDYRTRTSDLTVDEIEIFNRGALLSAGLIGEPTGTTVPESDLVALTNGRTTEGFILSMRQWLIDFNKRAELKRELQSLVFEKQLALLREKERATFAVITAAGISVTLVLAVLLFSEKRWQAVRERIACDLHDDLGANMISVAHTLELIKHATTDHSERISRLLDEAISTSFKTADETRQIVRLLSRNEQGMTWTDRVRHAAHQILRGVEFSLECPDPHHFNSLSPARQWDLHLFIKEAFNNIAKHAEASQVTVRLEKKEHLIIQIEDDGKGFSEAHLPIRHLNKRAKRLKGSLKIDTKPNRGTSIRLEI